MKLRKVLSSIIKSPFFLGFILTIMVSSVCFLYYIRVSNSAGASPFFLALEMLNKKTIDWRERIRGIQPVSKQIAIIAIDNDSIRRVGRWPWSRDKIATIVNNLKAYGARTLSFDIVYSEKDQSSARPALNELKSNIDNLRGIRSRGLTAVDQAIDQEISLYNTDQILANAIHNFSAQLVLGAFATKPVRMTPVQDACVDEYFQKSSINQGLSNEANPLVVSDNPVDLPDSITRLLDQKLATIATDETKLWVQTKGLHRPDLLEHEILQAQQAYCENFLTQRDPWLKKYQTAIKGGPQAIKKLKNSALINPIFEVSSWTMNIPLLQEQMKNIGTFNAKIDRDGVIRSNRLLVRTGSKYIASLGLRTFLTANDDNALVTLQPDPKNPGFEAVTDMTVINANSGKKLFKIPVNSEGDLLINYAGPQKMFPYVSAYSLLDSSPTARVEQRLWNARLGRYQVKKFKVNKSSFFKHKILIMGATATGIYDMRVTPFEDVYPGVETHANVVNDLVQRKFLRSSSLEEMWMPVFVLVLGILFSALLTWAGAAVGLALTVLSLLGLEWADQHFLFDKGLVINIAFPFLDILILYVLLTFFKYLTEERRKKELKGTFEKYVSPAIVREILADPSHVELGGRKQVTTVFFSDIRDFTSISEKLDPQDLSQLLNGYLTPMTRLIFEHRGTLDKYIGDAIMAFFGAPIDDPHHAKQACHAALANVRKLEELKREHKKHNLPNINIGIGLNTGEASVGNMGSDIVRNYTVMGDTVNLASRLENINKIYGTRIIISEFTQRELGPEFVTRELDRVRVKGKEIPIRIFELVDDQPVSSQIKEKLQWFHEGYRAYSQKKWQMAISSFEKSLQVDSEDAVSKLYIERSNRYLQEAPPEDWDGVFVLKTK